MIIKSGFWQQNSLGTLGVNGSKSQFENEQDLNVQFKMRSLSMPAAFQLQNFITISMKI